MTTRSVTLVSAADIKPGELAAVDVEGVRIAVANANGRFFAIDDTCTHEGCSLSEEGLQQNLWVTSGSGSCPSVWYRAISKHRYERNP